jgi:hypothetical protein
MAVVWLCLSVCFNGAVYSGFQVRFTKIPNFFQNLTISSKQMSQFQIQDQLYSKKKKDGYNFLNLALRKDQIILAQVGEFGQISGFYIRYKAEIYSKSWIYHFLKAHKISALLENFFLNFQGDMYQRIKTQKPL